MRGTLRIAALMARTNRGFLLGWSVGVIALVAVTIPGYAASYPSLASRGPLVEQLRATQATKVLYGVLPLPGTLGQLAQWETGSYVMLLLSTMGLLLAIRLGRGFEQSGAAEMIRATGTGRLAPVAASYLVQIAVFAGIGLAIAIDMMLQSRLTPEVSIVGGLTFAATFPLVGLGIGVATSILGEVFPDRASTRLAAWTFVAVEFGLRVLADFAHASWARWLTWFGLRDLVGPFSDDRPLPLIAFALVAILGAGMGARLHMMRSYGGGLMHTDDRSTRRLTVASPGVLALLLARKSVVSWFVAGTAVAALFGGMSRGLIELIRTDSGTASMIGNLTDQGSPAAEYFEFAAIFVTLVPLLCGISLMLRAADDEDAGFLDLSLSVGVGRTRPLAGQLIVSIGGCLGLLVLSALVEGAIVYSVGLRAELAWCLASVLARIPGLVCAVGLTALLVAAGRMPGAAWLLAVWSGFATLLGGLVRLPGPVRDASVLVGLGTQDLHPELGAGWMGRALVFAGLGVLAIVAARVVLGRRDIVRS